MNPAPFDVGFYGKLPSHGDFLRRRVSDAFVAAWDAWLQECLAESRDSLGDRWLDTFVTSPVWSFACAPGAAGPSAVAGVMAPSVDRVGRYFYVTVAATLPSSVLPGMAASQAAGFFKAAEDLVIEAVSGDGLDLEGFDDRVRSLRDELQPLTVPCAVGLDAHAAAHLLAGGNPDGWHLPLGPQAELDEVFQQVLWSRLAEVFPPQTLWWTAGSAAVEPSSLVTAGLPAPDSFAATLDGTWPARRWRSVPADLRAAAVESGSLLEELTPPRFRSAGATDVGRVRSVNQDSFLERPEVGVWAVADGVGGHSDGDVASRMVCDALADFVPDSGFEHMISEADERIRQVNDYLVRAASRPHHGSRCAVLWAGDSRVYRWRGGQLERLTRDHSLTDSEGGSSSTITKAVGGESRLSLDVVRGRVHAGDRFLLCSDGLTRTLEDAQISTWLAQEDLQAAVDGLIRTTLERGAPDNVTALIVEAFV
jgi:type VI secretion system protein ImpM